LPPDVADAVLTGGEFAALALDSSLPLGLRDAVRVDERGALTGRVSAVLGAERAARLVVPAEGSEGAALYLVRVADPGVTVTPRRFLDPSRGAADVRFENVVAQ